MKLTYLIPALALAGCSTLATQVFDPVEYDQWIRVSFTAQHTAQICGQPDVGAAIKILATQLEYATLYSSSKVQNPRVSQAAKFIVELNDSLVHRYADGTPSSAYCRAKVLEVDTAARRIAESLSKKES